MYSSHVSKFLQLPLELRYEIYNYLSPEEPVSYPFPRSPITSIDRQGPPRQLLLTCHKLYSEVRAHYYGLATFRFLALGSSRINRDEMSPGTLSAVQQAKKVELMLMWIVTKERAEAAIETWPWWMNGWLGEQVQLLSDEAQELETVIISLRIVSSSDVWQTKKQLLTPLRSLKGKVRFKVGDITAENNVKEKVKKDLEDYMADLNS